MIRTCDGFTISRADLTRWVAWFMAEKCKDMDQEVRDSLEQCLGGFFATEEEFAAAIASRMDGVKCPKCNGRGHNNLFLIGASKPGWCENCNGSGRISVGEDE